MKSKIAYKTADVVINYLSKGKYDAHKSERRREEIKAQISTRRSKPEWVANSDLQRIKQEIDETSVNRLMAAIFTY